MIFLNDKARSIEELESSEEEFVDCDSLHEESRQELIACDELVPDLVRKGRYRKRAAPKPPGDIPTIKATLVLKPGVVKPLETPDSECKEIFIQSPKSKRRTLINRSLSISKGKFDSSLSKLMNFPKKIRDSLEKRSSWHEFSKVQSKSDNDLMRSVEKSVSRVSIQSLTESPMARRRLKIIRRYVDEDID